MAVRGRIAIVLAALSALAGCGGGDDRSDGVRAYVDAVNELQVDAAPALQRANQVYEDFSQGDLPSSEALAGLVRAQNDIDRLQEGVRRLEPPREAETLHELLLRVLGLHADLAQESTQLALYLPAARRLVARVGPVNTRLGRRLKSTSPEAQARALRTYRGALKRVVSRLQRLTPPPIVAATHETQLIRLRTATKLAADLRTAVLARDAPGVARLLLRFRDVNRSAGDRALANAGIRAYDGRYKLIGAASADVRREENRLQRSLAG